MTPEQMQALMDWVEAKAILTNERGGAEENGEERAREDLLSAFGLRQNRYDIIVKSEDNLP